jgi:hypothetical protein
MNTPPDDLDARLARREPLFRRPSAADPLEPPADIDRIVLARARAALRDTGSDEAPRPSFFTLRPWVMPLGLAATLVFALAVVLRLGPDAGAPAPRVLAETDLRREAPDATAAAATPAPAADAPLAGKGMSEERMVARASMKAAREAEIRNTVAAEMPAAGRVQASAPATAALAAPAPPPPAAPLADASADVLAKASGGAGDGGAQRSTRFPDEP